MSLKRQVRQEMIAVMEAIDYQDGSFFKDLTKEVIKLKAVAEHASDKLSGEGISSIIRKHTSPANKKGGLNVSVVISKDNPMGPHILIDPIDKNHPLFANHFQFIRQQHLGVSALAKAIDKSAKPYEGNIDRKNGTVDGVFSDIEMTLGLSVSDFQSQTFQADELAAIILHEVGHAFTSCEYMGYQATFSHVMTQTSLALAKTPEPRDRKVIIATARKALNLQSSIEQQIDASAPDSEITLLLLNKKAIQIRDSGELPYNSVSFEAMSDQFAVRQGAGDALTRGLDKIYRSNGPLAIKELRPSWVVTLTNAYEITKLIASVGSGLPVVVFCLIATVFSNSAQNSTYDEIIYRFKRIRDQLVELLKDPIATATFKRGIREQIASIDKTVAAYNDNRTILEKVTPYLNPFTFKRKRSMDLIQDLEKLSMNEIFVNAADLSSHRA